MNSADRLLARALALRVLAAAFVASLALLAGCGKDEKKTAERPPVDVTVLTVAPRDTPVTATFVAQTQSSQAVNIQARVSGFLDKRMYVEGSVVKAGQVLFQMDQKPFQAQVDAQQAALARSQASLDVAKANLARTKPLAEQNALSQKDLDDAQGQYDSAAAAVEQGKAQLQEAKLNLSYTTITSPVTGVSSFAAVADGTYLDAKNAQLTTVSVLTPMWINFSISENEMERIRNEAKAGLIRLPENRGLHRRDRTRRRIDLPEQGPDHLRRPVVQPADRHVPDPRVRRQSGRHAAAEPVRPHAADRCGPTQFHPRSAARRPAGRARAFRLDREQGRQGRAAPGAGR